MDSPARFLFLACQNDACRMRLPASPAEAEGLVCPNCGGPLAVAATHIKASAADEAQPVGDRSPPLVALLDNVRSIHNVGSIFRSADGAGLAHIHLAGITATPLQPRLAKTALGAQTTVGWTYHRNAVEAAAGLKAAGYELWALERSADPAQARLFDVRAPVRSTAVVVGNERAGVDPGVLALCDRVLALPMAGGKSSLNVAVAFGIAVYQLRYARPAGL